MDSESLVWLELTEQARRIRARELTSEALVNAHLEQIARHPKLNAVVTLDAQRARAAAREADAVLRRGEPVGPLHGVPFTAKDTFATRGLRTSFASPLLRGHVPDYDATLVARLRAAGGVLLGKTNMPTFAFDWQTDNPFFGRTQNPWDLRRMVGGSSGGSAAALAGGLTPLCIGSDVGGSIRVPAHCCGVFGLRPTEGVLPDRGHFAIPGVPRTGRALLTCGPMARSARDLTLATSILWGPDSDNWTVPPVVFDVGPPLASLRGLRIAFSRTLGGVIVSRDTDRVLRKLCDTLAGAGCELREAKPDGVDDDEAMRLWGAILAPDFVAHAPWAVRETPLAKLGPLAFRLRFGEGAFAACLGAGLSNGMRAYLEALDARDRRIAVADRFFSGVDAWITPAGATNAFPHCRTGAPVHIDGRRVPYTDVFAPFHCTTTLLAHPIVAMPVGASKDGLPIGIQLHGRRFADARLLRIAELIEDAVGGFRRPALV